MTTEKTLRIVQKKGDLYPTVYIAGEDSKIMGVVAVHYKHEARVDYDWSEIHLELAGVVHDIDLTVDVQLPEDQVTRTEDTNVREIHSV
jgi:hypothetical protein